MVRQRERSRGDVATAEKISVELPEGDVAIGESAIGVITTPQEQQASRGMVAALPTWKDSFETLAQNANDGILISAEGGRYVYANRRATRITGYTIRELLGMTIEDLAHPDEVAVLQERYERRLQGKRVPAQYETRFIRKDGAELFIEITGSRTRWRGSTVDLIIFRNITRRKRLEEKVRRYTDHLEDEVRRRTREVVQGEKMAALGILVSGVAHEVNNPLSFIRSNTEYIMTTSQRFKERISGQGTDTAYLEELEELMRANLEGIDRISTITKILKRFARANAPEMAPSDVNQGLRDTLLMVHNKLRHRITVHEDFGDVPKVTGHIGQLNQAFINLILNASESMDTGNMWIRTWQEGGNVYVQVRDDGPGIPAEQLRHVFDPFFSTKEGGTGLGLSISHRIVKEHGGSITVRSEVGKGTAFTIRIPMGDQNERNEE